MSPTKEANRWCSMKPVSPVEYVGRMPPGSAILSRGQPGATTASAIGWFLREESAKIKSLRCPTVRCRAGALTENNCTVIPLMLLVGPLKPENFWEAWFNIKEPGSEAVLNLLARQPHQFLHFVGDSGRVELCLRSDNTLGGLLS